MLFGHGCFLRRQRNDRGSSSILKESAKQILNELCSLATLEVGAVSAIHQVAEYLDIDLQIPVDDSFDILFPREQRVTGDDYNAQMQRQHQAAVELGESGRS